MVVSEERHVVKRLAYLGPDRTVDFRDGWEGISELLHYIPQVLACLVLHVHWRASQERRLCKSDHGLGVPPSPETEVLQLPTYATSCLAGD